MHPVLFQWGPFTLHTYGLFAALGFLGGYGLAMAFGRRKGFSPALLGDSLVFLLLGGLLGARLFYVLFHSAEFAGRWMDIFKIWQGGLMWQGGLAGGIAAGAVYFKRRGLSALLAADILAPGVALGQAIGRVGCLFAGCCYGRACDLPWAVTFRDANSLAPTGVPLHPAQLYDAAATLALTALLLGASRAPFFRPGNGRLAALYLALSGAARLAVEPFRADARGPMLGGVSSTAVMAFVLFLIGAVGLLFLRRPRVAPDGIPSPPGRR